VVGTVLLVVGIVIILARKKEHALPTVPVAPRTRTLGCLHHIIKVYKTNATPRFYID